MPYNQMPGTMIGAGTMQFRTKYPNLLMPTYRVADANLVNPRHASCLLDGEFVVVDPTTGLPNHQVARAIVAPNSAGDDVHFVTKAGGAGNDTLGAAGLDQGTRIRMVHGRRGRSDNQFLGSVVVVMDSEFEFITRLVDTTLTYTAGDRLHVQLITNGNLPAYVTDTLGVARDVAGLVPLHRVVDANVSGSYGFTGICLQGRDANGWIRVLMRSGIEPLVGVAAA